MIIALLSIYLHYFIFIFITLLIVANFFTSRKLILTDCTKNIWTAVSSVLLPNAFISRHTVQKINIKETKNIFLKFYTYNGILFSIIFGIGALLTVNYFILNDSFIQYDCNNMPFLSYAQVYFI